MILLSAGVLDYCEPCYKYEDYKFIVPEMDTRLNKLAKNYSRHIVVTIKRMLTYSED